jgi:hypothetical protein
MTTAFRVRVVCKPVHSCVEGIEVDFAFSYVSLLQEEAGPFGQMLCDSFESNCCCSPAIHFAQLGLYFRLISERCIRKHGVNHLIRAPFVGYGICG